MPEETSGTESGSGALTEATRHRRISAIAVVFVLELALFFSATAFPIDTATKHSLVDQANSIAPNLSSPPRVLLSIFGNNVRVALLEMIPVLGAFFFAVSIFTTGEVVQAVGLSHNIPGTWEGAALFLFPFTVLELTAYAVAVTSGSMLLVAWWKGRLRKESRVFLLEVVFVVVLLAVAAAMETALLVSPALGFALWLPAGLGIGSLAILLRRRVGPSESRLSSIT